MRIKSGSLSQSIYLLLFLFLSPAYSFFFAVPHELLPNSFMVNPPQAREDFPYSERAVYIVFIYWDIVCGVH